MFSQSECHAPQADIGTPKTLDPASYSQLAAYVFQYAARYGSSKVADAKLTLGAGQPRVSGQGWLSGIEIRNEANGAWNGRAVQPPPFTVSHSHDESRIGREQGEKHEITSGRCRADS